MDLSKITSFALLTEKMKYNADRQQIISENFANADTPGYKRKELEKPNFDEIFNSKLSALTPATTHSNHLGAIDDDSINGRQIITSDNKVQLDMEAIELMQNSTSYAEAASTYKKFLSLLKEATGDGGSR